MTTGHSTRASTRRNQAASVLAAGAGGVAPPAIIPPPAQESAAQTAARLKAGKEKEKADAKKVKDDKAKEDKRIKAELAKKKKEDEAKKKADEPVPPAPFAPLAKAEVAKLAGEARGVYFESLAAFKETQLQTKETELAATKSQLDAALESGDDDEDDEDDEEVANHISPEPATNPTIGSQPATRKADEWQTVPAGSGFEVTAKDDEKPVSLGDVRRLLQEEVKKVAAASSPRKATQSHEGQMLARLPAGIRRQFLLGQYVNAYSLAKALDGLDDIGTKQSSSALQISLSGALIARPGKLRLIEDFSKLRVVLLKLPGLYIAARPDIDQAEAYQLLTAFGKYTRMLEGLVASTLHDTNGALVAQRIAIFDHVMRHRFGVMDFKVVDPLTGEHGVAPPMSLFGEGGPAAVLSDPDTVDYATLRASSIHELKAAKRSKTRKTTHRHSSDDDDGSSSENSAPAQGPPKKPKPTVAPTPKAPKAPKAPSTHAAQQPVLPAPRVQPQPQPSKLQLIAGAVDSNGVKIATNVCNLFNHARTCTYRRGAGCKFVHACLWCASTSHGIHEKDKCMRRFTAANGGPPF